MGWQNRGYSRTQYGDRTPGDWLRALFMGDVWIGTYFGINVRVHATLIWLVAFKVIFANSRGNMGLRDALTSAAILFGIILLHEFGHCFAARSVGGRGDKVLLWPLGGLAFVQTPQRPWPSFVGTAGGPLANVIICLITGFILLVLSGFRMVLPLNPTTPFGGSPVLGEEAYLLLTTNDIAYYLWWIFSVSYSLLFFNLLPIFPLDGGRILQTILWPKYGYYHSMNFACVTGMAVAGIAGLIGLMNGEFFLVMLALMGFLNCQQMRMALPEYSEAAWRDSGHVASGYSLPRRQPKAKRHSTVPRDDQTTRRNLNPFEWMARRRRKKQFERLMRDD